MLPRAHFAAVYAKPAGRPVIDTFVTEVSQDTWIYFPWDMGLSYQEPIVPAGEPSREPFAPPRARRTAAARDRLVRRRGILHGGGRAPGGRDPGAALHRDLARHPPALQRRQ